MPDLPTIAGGPGETASTPASSTGITLTANASANTKATTWTELIASTAYDADWVLITLGNFTGTIVGASTGYLVDIGVGASTAEQALISNLHWHGTLVSQSEVRTYLFPLRVPRGTRLSARCQASTGSGVLIITMTTISGPIDGPPGGSRVETLGAVTGTSRGTTLDTGASVNTDVVSQLVASTGFAYRWMCVAISNATDIATTGQQTFLLDIVTGAGGSEVPIISDLYLHASSTSDNPHPRSYCFPCAVAAGARVAGRARCSANAAGDRVLDLVAYGVG